MNTETAIKKILSSSPEIIFSYIFGSIAKGTQNPLSDIDIAIYVDNVQDLAEFKMQTLNKLMDALETDKIDLVILNTASLFLKAQVLQQKILLTDKNPFFRHKFESLTLREYFDFSIKERDIFKRRYSIG